MRWINEEFGYSDGILNSKRRIDKTGTLPSSLYLAYTEHGLCLYRSTYVMQWIHSLSIAVMTNDWFRVKRYSTNGPPTRYCFSWLLLNGREADLAWSTTSTGAERPRTQQQPYCTVQENARPRREQWSAYYPPSTQAFLPARFDRDSFSSL